MGRHSCCQNQNQKLRKGLWSPEEDEKLISYITKNGHHGSWSSLPKQAGLERCGKSCRLRWINYLRPDLKRGMLSAMEEKLIIQLHSMLGNRWSQIASYLPGRTDNEIKNYWNSCIKKKLKVVGIDPLTHNPLPQWEEKACDLSFGELNHVLPTSISHKSEEELPLDVPNFYEGNCASSSLDVKLHGSNFSCNGVVYEGQKLPQLMAFGHEHLLQHSLDINSCLPKAGLEECEETMDTRRGTCREKIINYDLATNPMINGGGEAEMRLSQTLLQETHVPTWSEVCASSLILDSILSSTHATSEAMLQNVEPLLSHLKQTNWW